MPKKKRIKICANKQEPKIEVSATDDKDTPLFCFRHFEARNFKSDHKGVFLEFVKRLQKISELGWNKISTEKKHGFGYELIEKKEMDAGIKSRIEKIATPDTKVYVFRAECDNLPFIGYRVDNIFHIIAVAASFKEFYKHG